MSKVKLNFEGLLSILPDCARVPLNTSSDKLPCYVDSHTGPESDGFTPPTLTLAESIDAAPAASPHIILVSAAGAVGKSRLAKEICRSKGSIYWDLAKAESVGVGSLVGELAKAFGVTDGLADVIKHVSAGNMFVVIDALDEANIGITLSSFTSFLTGVADLAKAADGVSFVLLGRTQIVETTWLVLADRNVRTAYYAIDYFDTPSSQAYTDVAVRRELLRLHKGEATAKFTEQYEDARDSVFGLLAHAVEFGRRTDGHTGREFLGYAPVLNAIAILLAEESNFLNLKNSLSHNDLAVRSPSMKILASIVEYILKREHEAKFLPQVCKSLKSDAPSDWTDTDWLKLYAPTEQCERLLGIVSRAPNLTGVEHVPQSLQAGIRKAIEMSLPDHPFLTQDNHGQPHFTNQVFESYVLACCLRSDVPAVRKAATDFVSRPRHLMSRLLADFYLTHEGDEGGRGGGPPTSSVFGLVHQSLLAGETDRRRLRLDIGVLKNDPDTLDILFEWFDPSADSPEAADLGSMPLSISLDRDQPLEFRSLRFAQVYFPGPVRLVGEPSFVLGPAVELTCQRLEIQTQELVVPVTPTDEEAVRLVADEFPVPFTGQLTARGTLAVTWPGSKSHPWIRHHTELPEVFMGDESLRQVYHRFRRIVMTLRSHKKGVLARFKDKVESGRVLRDRQGQEMLLQLLDDKILYLDNMFYKWNPDQARRHVSTDWLALRNGVVSDKLKTYIRTFADKHRGF